MTARRRLAIVAGVLAALLLLVGMFAAWALGTTGGARWLLRRADAAMPANLGFEQLQGSVLRGLKVGGFLFEDDGVRLDAERIEVDLKILPLFAKRLHVNRLFVDGAQVKLWPSSKADEPYMAMQLPVRLRLDEVLANRLRIEGLAAGPLQIDTLSFAGTWVDTRVKLERLIVVAPQGRVVFDGNIDLANLLGIEGNGSVRWNADGVAWRAALATRRHPTGTGVGLAVTAPLRARVSALLSGDHERPQWQARILVPEQTLPATLAGGTARRVALEFRGGGVGLNARFDAKGAFEGERFELSNARLRSTPATIFVDSLALALPDRDARLTVSGRVDRSGKIPAADLALRIDRVPIPGSETPQGAPATVTGSVTLRGWTPSFTVEAALVAAREELRARIDANIAGTPGSVEIRQLAVTSDQGELTLSGTLGLDKGAAWKLAGRAQDFDPALFAPSWPGAIQARFTFDGTLAESQPVGTLVVDQIGGVLRDRPIAGEATVRLGEQGRFAANGALRSAESSLAFNKPELDDPRIALDLDIASLGDLLPEARGRIEGQLTVDIGTRPPTLDGRLDGAGLGYANYALESFVLDATSPRGSGSGRARLDAQGLDVGGLHIDTLGATVAGTAARHALELEVDSKEIDLAIQVSGSLDADKWSGTLTQFDLSPRELNAWSLRAPVALAAGGGAVRMADPGICLTSGERVACADLDIDPDGRLAARWNIDRLPSAVLARIVELAGTAEIEIDSDLSSSGDLSRSAAGTWSGSGSASLSDGRVLVRRDIDPIVVAIAGLRLDFDAGPDALRARIAGTINQSGTLAGSVSLDPALRSDAPLSGDIALDFNELGWVEALSADIANSRGKLRGKFVIGGSLGAPTWTGEARLQDFFVEIPEYNVRLREADIRVTASADRAIAIEGTVLSGRDGSARVSGRITPTGNDGERLRLRITGDNFLAANRPDLMLRVTPDLTVVANDEQVTIEGALTIPRARIDVSRVEGGRRTSADVFVTDDPVEESKRLPITSDVTVTLGDSVALEGFGLDGKVSGRLRIRDRPGRETTGQGSLDVRGKYAAYGQRLDISRGRLTFNRTPLDNPAIDIVASRRVGSITAGIRVGGTAQAPDSKVFSSPAMDQSDALAYLVIGRPLRSASGSDAGAIANAAGALGGASGDLLAKSLGARMGLGDLAQPSAAFAMGRWLSPRLYLSYGISGLKGEPIFSLRFILREWLELETVVGTEVRAGINYRRER